MTPRKGYYKDLTGEKFGLWTVLSFCECTSRGTVWMCECECGKKQRVRSRNLQDGISKSCGCAKPRKGWIKGYLGYIPLANGLVAIASTYRVEDLQRWNWHAAKKQSGWYACRTGIPGKDKERRIYMARYILGMDPSDKRHADHKNRRTLDNRDRNLRPATRRQSVVNRGIRWDSVTRVKSIRRCKINGVFVGGYQVRLTHMGRELYLGAYDTIEEAARVRDEAARKLHGEFYKTGE